MTLLRRLRSVAHQTGLIVHGYCLMDNHVHAVLQVAAAPLSVCMRLVLGGYAHAFNRRRGRTGHVFEGPYDERPIRDERYLVAACTYILLNPVRAGICAHPRDWPWSSYQTSVASEPNPVVPISDLLLDTLDRRRNVARRMLAERLTYEAERICEQRRQAG